MAAHTGRRGWAARGIPNPGDLIPVWVAMLAFGSLCLGLAAHLLLAARADAAARPDRAEGVVLSVGRPDGSCPMALFLLPDGTPCVVECDAPYGGGGYSPGDRVGVAYDASDLGTPPRAGEAGFGVAIAALAPFGGILVAEAWPVRSATARADAMRRAEGEGGEGPPT